MARTHILTAALLGAVGGTLLSAPSAEAATTPPKSCNVWWDGSYHALCHDDFQQAISEYTHGKVLDAPRIPPAGGLSAALRKRISDATPGALGIVFQNADFTGASVNFVGAGCRTASTRVQRYNLTDIDASGVVPFTLDNRMNSEIGLNNCSVGVAEHPNLGGFAGGAIPTDYHRLGTDLYNKVSSVKFVYTPTPKELIEACAAGAATCTTESTGPVVYSTGPETFVAGAKNCGYDVAQDQTLSWWRTSTVTVSHDFEWDFTSKLEVGAADWLKIGAETTIKNTWGWSQTETNTFVQATHVVVPPRTAADVFISPTLANFTGRSKVWMSATGAYGEVPWTWTQEVATTVPYVTWKQHPVTASACGS